MQRNYLVVKINCDISIISISFHLCSKCWICARKYPIALHLYLNLILYLVLKIFANFQSSSPLAFNTYNIFHMQCSILKVQVYSLLLVVITLLDSWRDRMLKMFFDLFSLMLWRVWEMFMYNMLLNKHCKELCHGFDPLTTWAPSEGVGKTYTFFIHLFGWWNYSLDLIISKCKT